MAEIHIMKVNRKALKACMTCRLCNRLLRQPTTISLCLHTFCRECIYNRFSYSRVNTCPVCHVDLGGVPLDKLRRDHNLEDIRAKIFPLKGKKIKPSSEVITSIPKPTKRKKISLSTLASSVSEPSTKQQTNGNGDNDGIIAKREADGLTSLNHLVQDANKTKSSKHDSPLQSLMGAELNSVETEKKSESHVVQGSKTYTVENGRKEPDHGIKSHDDKNCINPAPRRETMPDGLSTSAKLTLNAAMNNANRQNSSVWLSLVAIDENGCRNGNTSLPQIPACYLRIKDSTTMVSSIQKYIVKKLQLSNEVEVEIRYKGRPIVPTAQLQNLVDLWLQNVTGKKVAAPPVGSSAKEFVLILSYCRRVQPS